VTFFETYLYLQKPKMGNAGEKLQRMGVTGNTSQWYLIEIT
jgi:hypothetical protein